jgi:Bacterial DNA-binding protein
MRKPHWWSLGTLAVVLGLIFGVTAPAQLQKPAARGTLPQLVAKKTQLDEDDVTKMLEALGPAIRDKLANGETVELPGLGTIRVVRVPEHKDLIQGRPGVVAATNNVELIALPEVVQAANAPNAVPATTVPAFEYVPLPNQTKGLKAPYVRQPNDRIR